MFISLTKIILFLWSLETCRIRPVYSDEPLAFESGFDWGHSSISEDSFDGQEVDKANLQHQQHEDLLKESAPLQEVVDNPDNAPLEESSDADGVQNIDRGRPDEPETSHKMGISSKQTQVLQPLKPKVNIHDPRARAAAADMMKGVSYGPNDIEAVIHGGQNVHSELKHVSARVQAGDPESIIHQAEGVHDDHGGKEDNREPTLLSKQDLGPTFERAVHGSDHVHDHQDVDVNETDRKVVRFQDILDLGLGEEALKGIDLSQLLEQERAEDAEWDELYGSQPSEEVRQILELRPAIIIHIITNPTEKDLKTSTNLRQRYLKMLNSRIRSLDPPDLDNAEWAEDYGQGQIIGGKSQVWSEPHPGESVIEHEMEMWGNTAPKAQRKPYSSKYRRRTEENV